jgi:hypothetical protein
MVVRTTEQPARDGGTKQPRMRRGCSTATLEKAAACRCAAYGERHCTAALEKTSDFSFLRYIDEVWTRSKAASGVRVRGVRDRYSHPIITEKTLLRSAAAP